LRDRGEQFLSLLQHAVDVIAVVGREGELEFVSPAVKTMLGYDPADVESGPISAIVQSDELDRLLRLVESLADHPGRSQTLELLRLRHRDGTSRWAAATLTNPPGQWGDAVVLNMHDVTTQRELEERLRHDALHDPLTGLLNRTGLREHVDRAWATRTKEAPVAVLFGDLDGFKGVNDELGHDAGDEVLVHVAERLRTAVRGADVVARWGGDEFVVLCPTVANEEDAKRIADRIRTAIEVPFRVGPGLAEIGISVGVALDSGQPLPDLLIKDADAAAYRAKAMGRNRIVIA